ncbi:unnamed protein product, partial [Symbiodinium sp. CCMP2592]
AFVRLRNLAEQIPEHAGSALRRRGVAVLRPGLSTDDVVGQDFLRRELQREDMTSAMSRLLRPDSQLFVRLGFGPAWCGEFQIRQAPPRKSGQEPSPPFLPLSGPLNVPLVWLQPLRYIPWLARLLKVVLAARVPVQPLAVRPKQQEDSGGDPPSWWWHSEVGEGDVIVLDHSVASDSPCSLPGEDALQEAGQAARLLGEALSMGCPPDRALEVCEAFAADVLDPAPYPAVGRQYIVQSLPSALIRREENVESDVVGELRPGSIVSILTRGVESPGRVEVFTEQAMRMPGYLSDEGPSGLASAGLKGWISSEAYNGTRLLVSLEPAEVPAATERQLGELSGALRGICAWVNVTLASASAGSTWRTEQICKRHAGTLEQMLLKSEHLSVEACDVSGTGAMGEPPSCCPRSDSPYAAPGRARPGGSWRGLEAQSPDKLRSRGAHQQLQAEFPPYLKDVMEPPAVLHCRVSGSALAMMLLGPATLRGALLGSILLLLEGLGERAIPRDSHRRHLEANVLSTAAYDDEPTIAPSVKEHTDSQPPAVAHEPTSSSDDEGFCGGRVNLPELLTVRQAAREGLAWRCPGMAPSSNATSEFGMDAEQLQLGPDADPAVSADVELSSAGTAPLSCSHESQFFGALASNTGVRDVGPPGFLVWKLTAEWGAATLFASTAMCYCSWGWLYWSSCGCQFVVINLLTDKFWVKDKSAKNLQSVIPESKQKYSIHKNTSDDTCSIEAKMSLLVGSTGSHPLLKHSVRWMQYVAAPYRRVSLLNFLSMAAGVLALNQLSNMHPRWDSDTNDVLQFHEVSQCAVKGFQAAEDALRCDRPLPPRREDEVFPAEIATVAIKPMQPRKQKANLVSFSPRLSEDPDIAEKQKAPGAGNSEASTSKELSTVGAFGVGL